MNESQKSQDGSSLYEIGNESSNMSNDMLFVKPLFREL